MIQNLIGHEGRYAGMWRLDSFLGDRDGKAFYMTTDVANATPALLEIIPSAAEGAGAVRSSWELAGHLSHENLQRVYETGETVLDDLPVFYAVLQLPDDDVGEILNRRALDLNETRLMLSGAASALDYLHKRNLQHGALTPSNVFLVGYTFKLNVDTVAPADRTGRQTDLRQLGGTLIQAMTRTADISSRRILPPPFREIAKGCLEPPGKQWTEDRVLQALSGRPARDSGSTASRRWWMMPAALALAIVALLGYWFTSSKPEPAAIPKPVEQPVAAVVPPTPKPSPLTPTRPRMVERQVDRKRGPAGSSNWSVIAATYSSFSAAKRRAAEIAKLSPRLQTHVYPPDGQGKTYYVVLGSGLTQSNAADLRDRARRLGAPGDTYVTKLDER